MRLQRLLLLSGAWTCAKRRRRANRGPDPLSAIGPTSTAARFSPWTLTFHDGRPETLFIADNNRRAVPAVRVVAGLYLGVTLAITLFDFAVSSPVRWELLPYRLSAVLVTVIGLWATGLTWVVRRGQFLLGAVMISLHAGFYFATGIFGEYVLAAVASYVMTLAMTLSIPALLFRVAAPIALLATIGYAERMVAFMPGVSFTVPIFFLFATLAVLGWGNYASERGRRTAWAATRALAREKARSEALLLNVLPPSVAARMNAGERLIADSHEFATVLFADIVGFTPLSEAMPPADLIALLDRVFTRFDAIADVHDLEKIKTIGDAYMLAAGAPAERPAEPQRVCDAALEMRAALADIGRSEGIALGMRIGIHAGPVIAGVIGRRKFIYDIWGTTVNTASRMESTAPAGAIQVSAAVRDFLADRFTFTPRGEIEMKGIGALPVFLLEGRKK